MVPPPAPRRLFLAWAVLAGLTVASMTAALPGDGGSSPSAGPLAWPVAAFVLAVTWVKARKILAVYLNLSTAPAGWRGFLGGLVMLILGLVLGGHLLVALLPGT